MLWPCEFNKRASTTCHPERSRRIPRSYLKASAARSLGPSRTDGFIGGRQECLPYKFGPLQTQPSWNQNAIEQIEKELHQQRQQRRWNCAFQNRDMIVQIESANDWFA